MSEAPPEQQRRSAADDFGLEAVRELLQMISETDVTEICIERGDARLVIKRGAPAAQPQVVVQPVAPAIHHAPAVLNPPAPVVPAPAAPAPTPAAPQVADHPEALPPGSVISAPMVGTFYAAASPKDPPFVSEGDTIHAGDKVGIIEAMKMMNEIESELSGRVTRILVKNGQPVEYGQPLMVVEPL
ncbi:MAG TPA: acetyl-CoA carboxylase biotin carboxyl carrier protein [Roseiflexaceae bacterium]|nr:acetyl-CoA carboxylase biotin carboxyl carrier protein [Roseiflexaceae bacterium]